MIGFPSVKLAVSSLTDFKRRKAAIKEPETVAWLTAGFQHYGSFSLIDIGANIGGYSLIACALDQNCRVVAVEPFPPTFKTLCRNIALNGFGDRVTAVNGFFGTVAEQQSMALSFDAWSSGLAEHKATGRYSIRLPIHDIQAISRHLPDQGPVMCKIDVDGGERAVMAGIMDFLPQPRLKSVLIECDTADAAEFGRVLNDHGLNFQSTFAKTNQRQVNLIASREQVLAISS